MFTGIIESLGTIKAIKSSGQGKHITIDADISFDQVKVGDSIAVDGACLTATVIQGNRFDVDVSPETVSKTTLGSIKIGDRVNLERALQLNARIDGHLVSGHIDGLGVVGQKKVSDNAILIDFTVPNHLLRYMIPKGSIAVDGISLTINKCSEKGFDVSIIPHTSKLTNIGLKKAGDKVNIETDMIGKYVENFTTGRYGMGGDKKPASSVDMELLGKTGFI
jgi:riboflavin synthase